MSRFSPHRTNTNKLVAMLCIGALALLVCLGGLDWFDKLTDQEMPRSIMYSPSVYANQPVSSSTTPSVSAPSASMPSLRMSSHNSLLHHGTAAVQYVTPYETNYNASTGRLRSSSSRRLNSYGGGTTMSAQGSSQSRSAGQVTAVGTSSVSAVYASSLRRRNTTGYSSSLYASAAGVSGTAMSGPRRVTAEGDGEYAWEEYNGQYWDEDAEEWVDNIPVGATKIEGGQTYTWNGSAWVVTGGDLDDLGTPVGAVPVVFMLLLVAGYIVKKKRFTNAELMRPRRKAALY